MGTGMTSAKGALLKALGQDHGQQLLQPELNKAAMALVMSLFGD